MPVPPFLRGHRRLRQPQPDHGELGVLCGLPRGLRRHSVEEPRQGGHSECCGLVAWLVECRPPAEGAAWVGSQLDAPCPLCRRAACLPLKARHRTGMLTLPSPAPLPPAGHRGAAHHARRPAAVWSGELQLELPACLSCLRVLSASAAHRVCASEMPAAVMYQCSQTIHPSALIRMLPIRASPCQQMDEKIPEPLGAAHTDPMGAFPAIRKAILDNWRRWACRGWRRSRLGPGAVLGPAAQPHMARVVAGCLGMPRGLAQGGRSASHTIHTDLPLDFFSLPCLFCALAPLSQVPGHDCGGDPAGPLQEVPHPGEPHSAAACTAQRLRALSRRAAGGHCAAWLAHTLPVICAFQPACVCLLDLASSVPACAAPASACRACGRSSWWQAARTRRRARHWRRVSWLLLHPSDDAAV